MTNGENGSDSLFEKNVFAVRTDGYSPDRDTGDTLKFGQIVKQWLWKCVIAVDTGEALLPTGIGYQLGFDFHLVKLERNFISLLAVNLVMGTHFHLFEIVHNIGLGDKEFGDPVEHTGIA